MRLMQSTSSVSSPPTPSAYTRCTTSGRLSREAGARWGTKAFIRVCSRRFGFLQAAVDVLVARHADRPVALDLDVFAAGLAQLRPQLLRFEQGADLGGQRIRI